MVVEFAAELVELNLTGFGTSEAVDLAELERGELELGVGGPEAEEETETPTLVELLFDLEVTA